MDPTIKVAKNFPDVKFEHGTGYKRADNVSDVQRRASTRAATSSARSRRGCRRAASPGYIASFPIPEVVRGINSFMLGAQSINPDFKVKVVWVSTWFDPGKEADAAKVLIGQGADIITQHTDSTAPLQIAAEQGAVGFGQASDMIASSPRSPQLTAIIDDWAPYYVRTRAMPSSTAPGSPKTPGTAWGPAWSRWRPTPTCRIMSLRWRRRPRRRSPPANSIPSAGPIHKQDGSMAIGEGEHLDDGTLLGMNWYVKGVDDKLPE